ncbi:MAG: carbon starvation CstA family protein [Candidatus Delongbacteria bacterium]
MIVTVLLVSVVVLAVAYWTYGRFLARYLSLDDSQITPACELNDGVDFVPAERSMLLGQHFSAISAAGPIVGPILAGIWFGWLPALLWILIGSVFIGGVHDFTSLVASVKNKAASIGEIVRTHMSRTSQILFLVFVWMALDYVIIAFTDITAQTFASVTADAAFGPGVAVSSGLYLLLGLAMGVLLYRFKTNLTWTTALFIPLVLLTIWLGTQLPEGLSTALLGISVKQWELILLAYCLVASLLPMWLLLQPRGYLGGWFLYLVMGVALLGTLFGGQPAQYPALNLDGLASAFNGKLLFPILFITVACGACSGFHGIISSGTTSKQIRQQSDTKAVGYGAMLLEGLVAVLALATVMILAPGDEALKAEPSLIFAKGIAGYLGHVGVSFHLALSFALLAFSTFVYDTLDVCTRLARYILQELFGWQSARGALLATGLTLLLPLVFLMLTKEKGYVAAWPIFGTSNQLLASLTLLAVSVWLMRSGRNAIYTLLPMAFMLGMTLWALVTQILPFARALAAGTSMTADVVISGVMGSVLLVLAVWLLVEAWSALRRARPPALAPGAASAA